MVILLAQISEKEAGDETTKRFTEGGGEQFLGGGHQKFYVSILDMDLFPGPHSQKRHDRVEADAENTDVGSLDSDNNVTLSVNEAKSPTSVEDGDTGDPVTGRNSTLAVECLFRYDTYSWFDYPH